MATHSLTLTIDNQALLTTISDPRFNEIMKKAEDDVIEIKPLTASDWLENAKLMSASPGLAVPVFDTLPDLQALLGISAANRPDVVAFQDATPRNSWPSEDQLVGSRYADYSTKVKQIVSQRIVSRILVNAAFWNCRA